MPQLTTLYNGLNSGEYYNDRNHYYRLRDLHKVLCALGKISEEDNTKFRNVISRPSGVDSDHPKLQSGQNIIIDLSTLVDSTHKCNK